jgi:hypothetical protein
MVAIVDPRRVRYPPESLIEAIDVDPVAPGGTPAASYLLDPFDACIENICLKGEPVDTQIAADGFPEVAKVRNNAVAINGNGIRARVYGTRSLEVKMFSTIAATSLNHVWCRYNVTVQRPYIDRKIRLAGSSDPMRELKAEERRIALDPAELIRDNVIAGTDPYFYRGDYLSDQVDRAFKEIIPVQVTMTAPAACASVNVGHIIDKTLNPSRGQQVWVLLGVAIEYGGDIVPSNTYLDFKRDDDPHYMLWDLSALPRNRPVRCFVPFLTEMVPSLVNMTALDYDIGISLWYGVRNMAVLDHMRWDIPYNTDDERLNAEELIKKHNLWDLVNGGMLP